MGMTFSLDRPYRRVDRSKYPCPECQGSGCLECYGEGVDLDAYYAEDSRLNPGFHVSNCNGIFIQQTILGIEPSYYGSIDVAELCWKLTSFRLQCAANAELGVKPIRDNHGIEMTAEGIRTVTRVIDCGRSQSQIDRYVDQLSMLVDRAMEAGIKRICWA